MNKEEDVLDQISLLGKLQLAIEDLRNARGTDSEEEQKQLVIKLFKELFGEDGVEIKV